MSKIVTLHQPNYLPWLGFFSKIRQSDCYVMTDIHDFSRHSVTNRNKIRTSSGWDYLTVPVDRRFHGARICDVGLPSNGKWRQEHWKALYHNYGKSPFFDRYRDFFEELYRTDFESLCQLNTAIILYLLKCFDIKAKVLKASDMGIDPSLLKTDLQIALLRQAGADTYLSGPSGKNYLDFEKFPGNGLELKFFEFTHPVYPQRYPGFEPAMSAIDLLFNVGPEASNIIETSGEIVTTDWPGSQEMACTKP